jgi:hypothetical protein
MAENQWDVATQTSSDARSLMPDYLISGVQRYVFLFNVLRSEMNQLTSNPAALPVASGTALSQTSLSNVDTELGQCTSLSSVFSQSSS